ncbi:MAG: hypothetical protein V4850_17730 [Myxococcota bacterium]
MTETIDAQEAKLIADLLDRQSAAGPRLEAELRVLVAAQAESAVAAVRTRLVGAESGIGECRRTLRELDGCVDELGRRLGAEIVAARAEAVTEHSARRAEMAAIRGALNAQITALAGDVAATRVEASAERETRRAQMQDLRLECGVEIAATRAAMEPLRNALVAQIAAVRTETDESRKALGAEFAVFRRGTGAEREARLAEAAEARTEVTRRLDGLAGALAEGLLAVRAEEEASREQYAGAVAVTRAELAAATLALQGHTEELNLLRGCAEASRQKTERQLLRIGTGAALAAIVGMAGWFAAAAMLWLAVR